VATIFNSGTPVIVANIEIDQRTGEYHSASAQKTKFATESGSNRSDHIILDDDKVELTFVIENKDDDLTAYGTRAAVQFEKLKNALRERKLFDVVTRHYLYTSMVLLNISAENTSPFSGRLTGRVSFEKFNETSIDVVEIPAKQLNGTAKQSASSSIDSGRQEPESVNPDQQSSLLNQLFS
jgi:hypothetical protein